MAAGQTVTVNKNDITALSKKFTDLGTPLAQPQQQLTGMNPQPGNFADATDLRKIILAKGADVAKAVQGIKNKMDQNGNDLNNAANSYDGNENNNTNIAHNCCKR